MYVPKDLPKLRASGFIQIVFTRKVSLDCSQLLPLKFTAFPFLSPASIPTSVCTMLLANRMIQGLRPEARYFPGSLSSQAFLGSDCFNGTQMKTMSRRNLEKAGVGSNQLALSDQVSVIHKRPLSYSVVI